MNDINPDVLLIDENSRDRSDVHGILNSLGLNVMQPRTPLDSLSLLDRRQFKLAIVDTLEDPNLSLDLVRRIKSKSEVPIIGLVDKQKFASEDSFLKAGADDYVPKPINDQLLSLRVAQQLNGNNSKKLASAQVYKWNELTLDGETCEFTINGKYVSLTRTEYLLLSTFLSNPERVFTRPQLLNAMKVMDGIGSDHLIDTHLSRLRVKIRQNGGGNYIYAIRGIGVRFSEPNHSKKHQEHPASKVLALKEPQHV